MASASSFAPKNRLRLFVYGSLKRGGRHHDELEGAVFLGAATTVPGYRLEPLGAYLALVADPSAGRVPGELYELDEHALPGLDAFEGEAYERRSLRLEKFGFALAYFEKAR